LPFFHLRKKIYIIYIKFEKILKILKIIENCRKL